MSHSAAVLESVELAPFPSLRDLEGQGLDRKQSGCESCASCSPVCGRIVCLNATRDIDAFGFCRSFHPGIVFLSNPGQGRAHP